MLEPSLPEALICCSPEITNMYLRPLLYHFGGGSARAIRTLESTSSTVVFSVCEILKLTSEREKTEGKTVTSAGQRHAAGQWWRRITIWFSGNSLQYESHGPYVFLKMVLVFTYILPDFLVLSQTVHCI